MHAMRAFAAAALVLVSAGSICADDALLLKDGRIVEGVRIERADGGFRLHYKAGAVFVPAALVREVLLVDAAPYEPKDDKEKEKLAQGLVPFEGKWMKLAERDAQMKKRIAEQRKRLETVKAHREWRNRYTAKGRAFDFDYTVDPEIFENLKNLMETYYTVFTKDWGITRPPKLGNLKVCFYHNYDAFLQVGGVGRGVLGYYRFVEPLELNFFYDRTDPDFTIEVMFHEANHYLTHLIDLEFHYPHCINEAFAEYYGASRWDPVKKQMSVGHLLDGRLTEVQTDIAEDKWAKLDEYLRNQLDYDDYTWGWTFVHFMMETPKYKPKFKKFYRDMPVAKDIRKTSEGGRRTVAGDDLLEGFKRYVGVKDLKALEAEWHAYVKKLKSESSRGYEHAGLAAYRTGRPIKAKKFLKLAIDKGSASPTAYATLAEILAGEGEHAEAIRNYEKAIELDPLNADHYADLGRTMRHLGTDEKKKEGLRFIRLALEMDPDNLQVAIDDALRKELAEPAEPAEPAGAKP